MTTDDGDDASIIGWEEESSVLSNALGSAGAGILSRCLTHPLDTAKARLQVDRSMLTATSARVYQGPVDVLRQTWATEGIRGWYRGFSTVIVGGTPGTILYLCSYDIFKNRISLWQRNVTETDTSTSSSMPNGSFLVHFCSGLLAEATACIVYVPVDVIKERLQVQQLEQQRQHTERRMAGNQESHYKGGMDAFRKIIRNEGWHGIYRGYGATLASFGPFSALYFVFYEQFKYISVDLTATTGESLSLPYVISSSAAAGALASFLTSPLDMAKLRLQVQRRGGNTTTSYHGIADCLHQAYHGGGISGLFRGAGARVLHFVPATTVTMTTYESMRSFFHDLLFLGDR